MNAPILKLFLALAVSASALPAKAETAYFAGGCFWCVESDMDSVKGVTSTISGYAGGALADPTYQNHEGHAEAVKVEFDPSVVSYSDLTAIFLRSIDVTDAGGQFCDRGSSYRPVLFPQGKEQESAALKALKDAEKDLGSTIAVPSEPFTTFYPAEDYHQDYYLGQSLRLTRFGPVAQSKAYKLYREGCGRDERVKAVWGDKAYMGIEKHSG
jgi:peptide-methionine (S)-S-oxide reductase